VETIIETLMTKEGFANFNKDMKNEFANFCEEMANEFRGLRNEIAESKAYNIKWMFIFWIGQVAATLTIVFLFVKK
jgi:hypothetical protein